MKRILLGGIAAGLVVFAWGFISHMLLPIGEIGMRSVANDDAVVEALKPNLGRSGIYFFPGMPTNLPKDQQAEAEKAFTEKYRRGPSGIIVYTAEGRNPISPSQLVIEVLSNIAGGIVAAFLLSMAAPNLLSFGSRLIFVALLGLFSTLAIDVSYWNWYGFPGDYTLATMCDQIVSWFIAGLVLAKMIKPR